MKTKIKKKKRKIYECFECRKDFCHKPYRKLKGNKYGQPLIFCKSDCWKSFSSMIEQSFEEMFYYEVLLSYPVQQFIDYLKNHVDYENFHDDYRRVQIDYKKVLKYIEDSIKESRTKKIK